VTSPSIRSRSSSSNVGSALQRRAARRVEGRAVELAAADGDDETEAPEVGKKPLDFGDPLAGVLLEEESLGDSDAAALAPQAFGDDDIDLLEGEADAGTENASALDVGGLVPSLPTLAVEPLEPVTGEASASAFLQDDWSRLGDDVGPDDLGDTSGLGSFIPHGVTETFDELGDGSEEGPLDVKEAWSGALALELDDSEPALARVAWSVARESAHDVHALLLSDSHAIAAGARLTSTPRTASGGDSVVATPPHPLVGVVPGLESELLCASAVGSLYRYSPERGFQLESELHRRLGLPLDASVSWKLQTYRLGPGRTGIAALCSNGRLLLSDADRRLRSQLGRAAVLGTGLPLTLIHPHDGSLGLRRLEDPAGRWRELPLGVPAGLRIDASTELCCHGELVALAHESLGVWLSRDHGQHFQRVPGTTGVTAIHFGLLDGRLVLFVASVTAAPAIRVLVCDPSSLGLECVAELEPSNVPDAPAQHAATAERDEWTARALLWDSRSRALWLGGSLGLVRLSPP
jgi:hypothetical protein